MNKTGFTLIELTIYVTIAVLIVGSVTLIAANVLTARARHLAIEEVNQSARRALDQIVVAISRSSGINSPGAGLAAPTLSLSMDEPERDPTIFDQYADNLRVRESDSPDAYLLPEKAILKELEFLNVTPVGQPGAIRVTLRLAFLNPLGRREYDVDEVFYATASVRSGWSTERQAQE